MVFQRFMWSFYILCALSLVLGLYSFFIFTVERHQFRPAADGTKTEYCYRNSKESSSYMTVNLTEVIENFMKFKSGKDIYTRVMHADIFIYSAIGLNNTDINNQSAAPWTIFGLSAWKHFKVPQANLSCCFLYQNGIIRNSKVKQISTYLKSEVQSFRFECMNPNLMSKPRGVTLIVEEHTCNSDISTYVAPVFTYRQPGNNTLALCAKVAFGNLNSALTVEWLEYTINMGVDKIAVFVSNLSSTTSGIFQHYQKSGFLEIHPFDLPMLGTIKRKLGEKTVQSWSDEQIPVFDCMDRLAGYSIVGLVDFDEFIFPLQDQDFKQFVNRIRTTYPDSGLFSFLVDVFVIDWGKTNESENLTIAQFRNRTKTMADRIKNFIIPERIQTGSVSTHNAEPKQGYKRTWIPDSLAVLKHFRSCRFEWGKKCHNITDFPRFTDDSLVKRLLEKKIDRNISLYDHLLKVKQDLKLIV
ncbi:hypothetical protein ACJMK2_019912 [Sinanodonta woodiana]|uniref:Glycosyltransferase family 92 protein n=1 Tax=Sinanodonta woodiana TaxID=1069815 RepID=A0ABD3TYP9_SINWO